MAPDSAYTTPPCDAVKGVYNPTIELVAVQIRAIKGDWRRSAQKLDELLAPLGTASLIVCPEMALTGYVFPNPGAARMVAEASDGGPTFELASRFAKRHHAYFVIGYPEAGPDGRLFNSAMIFDPNGRQLLNYRKRLLYDQDETWAQPGDTEYPLIETPFGLLTAGICMDLNDDAFIDHLFDARPDVVAFPTNWLDQNFDVRLYWRWRLQGYPCWLVAANTYGVEEGIPFRGRSAILRPDGQTVAAAPAMGDRLIAAAAQPARPWEIG